jgi:integrase
MAKLLTPLSIQNAKMKRRNGQPVLTELSDAGCRGLRLCLHPTGRRVWIVRYRFGGRSRKLTLGGAIVLDKGEDPGEHALTLSAARKAAAEALHKVERGIDPGVEKAAKQKPAAAADSVEDVCAKYLKREGGKLRSVDQRKALLQRAVYPVLGSRQADTVKRSEIVRLLDKIEDERGPVAADMALAILRRIFSWHAARDDDFRSPIIRGMARTKPKERARDRILSDDEVRAVWAAASDEAAFSALIRFLLFTGARRNEAARMSWPELANGIWTLPAQRNKTKKELARPLSKAAQAVLTNVPRTADSDLVFFADGHWLFNNLAALKRNFDKRCGVTGWRLHDLRRTARSLMSRAGVPDNHAERCLGHVIGGVQGTYDRHKYQAEMLQAYEKLAVLIANIVNPRENVVPLHA